MASPNVTGAFFSTLEPGNDGWVLQISLVGDGFVSRAMPLVGQVGDVDVEALAVFGDGAVGYLSSIPTAGARLRVAYLDHELQDTDITFGTAPNA